MWRTRASARSRSLPLDHGDDVERARGLRRPRHLRQRNDRGSHRSRLGGIDVRFSQKRAFSSR